MTRLPASELLGIITRYEAFSGPEAEAMKFEQYSELYDQFVDEDLPRLVEHVKALEAEIKMLRGR